MNYMKYENRSKEENLKRGLSLKDYDSLSALVTIISTDNVNVFVPSGIHLITADLTIPSNITLVFENGGILSVADTKTLTLNCSINAGAYQIFAGAGDVTGAGNISEVYPEWFGAVGNGVADDTTALNLTLKENNVKLVGTYLATSDIEPDSNTRINMLLGSQILLTNDCKIELADISNVSITGDGNILSTGANSTIRVLRCSNIHIDVLKIENTNNTHASGLVYLVSEDEEIYIKNTQLVTGSGAGNCIAINPNSETSYIKGVYVENNTFTSARMGLEITNHSFEDTVPRYQNINICNNIFKEVGIVDIAYSVSLSGYGKGCRVVGNTIIGNTVDDIGIENVGCSEAVFKDNYFDMTIAEFKMFSFSNVKAMKYCTLDSNRMSADYCAIPVYIQNLHSSKITNNKFGYTRVIDCTDLIISGNDILSSDTVGMILDRTGSSNVFRNNISTENAASNDYVLIFYGVGSSGNKAFDNKLTRSTNDDGKLIHASPLAVGNNFHSSNTVKSTVVLLGDSLTFQNSALSQPQPEFRARGYFTWANTLLNQRFEFIENLGVGGERTDQVADRIGDVIDYSPDYCILLAGANDLMQDVALSTIQENLQFMYDALESRGITIIAGTVPPNDSLDASSKEDSIELNSWIIAQQSVRRNYIVVDWASRMTDPSDSSARTNMLNSDNIHPSIVGAYEMGNKLYEVMDPRLQDRPIFDGSNLSPTSILANPYMLGDDGQGRAVSWQGSGTFSKVARDYGMEWAQVEVTGTEDDFYFFQQMSSGFTVGDTIEGYIEFEVDSAITSLDSFNARIQCKDGSTQLAVSSSFDDESGTIRFPDVSLSGIMYIPPVVIPEDTDTLVLWIEGTILGKFRAGRTSLKVVS